MKVLWRIVSLSVCLALVLSIAPAPIPDRAVATPAACARLISGSFKPADVKAAYAFVKNNSQCVPKFEDTTFLTVAGALTSAKLAGVITANTCTQALSMANQPTIQTMINQVGAGVAASHLQCGCAVANSGVTEKIEQIVADIKSCGQSFNPVDWASDGLNAATDTMEGLGATLGIGGKYAEGPNGGAPTYNYGCPSVGTWMTAEQRSPVGYCTCPPRTSQEWGNIANGGSTGSSRCISACAKTEVYKGGQCLPCTSGGYSGGVSYQNYPDETGTQCLSSGSGYAVTCYAGQVQSADRHSCVAACPFNAIADPKTNVCTACPPGTKPLYSKPGSSLGQCRSVRSTEPMGVIPQLKLPTARPAPPITRQPTVIRPPVTPR